VRRRRRPRRDGGGAAAQVTAEVPGPVRAPPAAARGADPQPGGRLPRGTHLQSLLPLCSFVRRRPPAHAPMRDWEARGGGSASGPEENLREKVRACDASSSSVSGPGTVGVGVRRESRGATGSPRLLGRVTPYGLAYALSPMAMASCPPWCSSQDFLL
jgi:hypothetical protein